MLTPKQKFARLELPGALLLIAAFVCLLLALQWGGTTFPWSSARVWGCLTAFGLLLAIFIALQIHLKDTYDTGESLTSSSNS